MCLNNAVSCRWGHSTIKVMHEAADFIKWRSWIKSWLECYIKDTLRKDSNSWNNDDLMRSLRFHLCWLFSYSSGHLIPYHLWLAYVLFVETNLFLKFVISLGPCTSNIPRYFCFAYLFLFWDLHMLQLLKSDFPNLLWFSDLLPRISLDPWCILDFAYKQFATVVRWNAVLASYILGTTRSDHRS